MFQSNSFNLEMFANLYEMHRCFMVISPELAIDLGLLLANLFSVHNHRLELYNIEPVFEKKN